MSQQLGAKWQDPGPPDRLPVDNHPSTQVRGSSAFGIDSPAAANVLTEGGHHAQVGCQLLGMKIGRAAANHDQVNAFRQGLVAQWRELDKLGTEGLKRFESVRKITAKCLILRISDSEAPAAVRKAAGTRRANGRGERAATGQIADRIQVAVAKKIGRKAGKQFLGKHLVAGCSLQPPTNRRHRFQGPEYRNGKGQANESTQPGQIRGVGKPIDEHAVNAIR